MKQPNRTHENTIAFAKAILEDKETRDVISMFARRERAVLWIKRGQLIFDAKALCPFSIHEREQLKVLVDRDRIFREFPTADHFTVTDTADKYSIGAGCTHGFCIRLSLKNGRKIYFCWSYTQTKKH